MTYYPHSGGGFVFSVGSLCFTGSLADDPTLQQIVRNVLAQCLERGTPGRIPRAPVPTA
ncbi:MAG TPA: hypothetical protein VFE60_21985 [Roseiarcus sp.]|jgi:hypothetical protein|nr:hypothetical protein [Roseiarcus sp.]